MKKKYSVLTCLFGKYEKLQEVCDKREDIEYICITDDETLTSKTWEVVYADSFLKSLPFVNQWTYIRYHPYEFVHTDICLYIDASIEIIKDFTDVLIKPFIESNKEYGVLIHPWRSNIGEETNAWVKKRNYSEYCAKKIFKWLNDNRYCVNGLIQSSMLLTKNTKDVHIINNRTWELCHQWSDVLGCVDRNNQVDLTYVVNTLYYDSSLIEFYSIETIKSEYLHWKIHEGIYYEWDGYNTAIAFNKKNVGKKI